MNFEYYIAGRVGSNRNYKNSVSAPIIKIAVAAIAVGMVVMLVAIGTGVGLQRKIKKKISAFNGHISVAKYDLNNSMTSVAPINLDQSFYPEYSNFKNVVNVQPVATKGGIVRLKDAFEGVIFKGVMEDYDWTPMKEFLVKGRLPKITNEKEGREILISQTLSNRLQLKVGDKAPTYFIKPDNRPIGRAFEVVGIYNSGLEEYDEKFILGDLANIQKINGWTPQQVGSFEVFASSMEEIDFALSEIYTQIPPELNAESIQQQFPMIFQWLELLDTNIYGIIGIILIVSIINMMTALLVLIMERTPMIGLLKSLGTSNWSIRKMFLYNAGQLIVRGLLIGNVVGLLILGIQHYLKPFTLDPETYYVSTAPISLDLWHLLAINAGTVAICVLVLVIPSYLVSRISPVKAMRFE